MAKDLLPDTKSLRRLEERLRRFGQVEEANQVAALARKCEGDRAERLANRDAYSKEIAEEEAAYLERRKKAIEEELTREAPACEHCGAKYVGDTDAPHIRGLCWQCAREIGSKTVDP